jgi:glycosyltransferase involved in cell wall biosynthesis
VTKVSIAVPAFNAERYIAKCLESLLAQTFTDFELVISDNASTDGTEDICRRYAAKDSRIRYVRRSTNIGGPANFRYVFELCSGKYHKWAAADDYWAPTFLEKAVAVLDAHPDVVLCYPTSRLVGPDDETLSDYEDNLDLQADSPRQRFNDLYRLIGLCNAPYGLIRRDAMSRTRLFGPEVNSDTHFLAELSLYGKFYLLRERLFFRRMHEGCSSWRRDSEEHQRNYYDPGRRFLFGLHIWRKYMTLPGRIWRAPIPLADKLGLTKDLARWAYWERKRMYGELSALVAPRWK